MNPRKVGQYVELQDRKSDYTGMDRSQSSNITRVSAAAAGHQGLETEKHGIRKTVTVETMRQGGAEEDYSKKVQGRLVIL
jgi:hypothetical protein